MEKSLILTLKAETDIVLVKDLKTQEVKIGDSNYDVILKNISFMKKMYEPGVITANIQFKLSGGTTWKTISKSNLDNTFKDKEVELAYGEPTKGADGSWSFPNKSIVCSGYYIHELNPSYKSDSLFVTMIIYSADKQLTLTENCQSWVSKRLCRDIIDGNKANFKLPYDSSKNVEYDYSNLKRINVSGDHKEAIFPYLVQYDESYYDFLVRTCNRWGEFLYFENGMLKIGYDDTKKTDVKSYSSYNFCNLNEKNTTPTSANNIGYGATYDDPMLNTILEKGTYDSVKGVLGCTAKNGGDIWGTKVVGNLFTSGKNLFDFVIDTLTDEGIAATQANVVSSGKNDTFNDTYFKASKSSPQDVQAHYDTAFSKYNEFSDQKPHLTSDLYKQVVAGELNAAQNAVCINFDTSYIDLKLGEIINLDGQQYIVVQVNTNEKEDLVIDFDNKTTKKVSTTTYQVIAIKAATDNSFYPTVHPAGHIRTSGPQRAKVVVESMKDPIRQSRVKVQFPWQSDMTPWLEFTRTGGNNGTGTFHRHYVDEEVLVAFVNNNVERPYVVGALATGKQKVPLSTYTNNIVHVTPGGQAIKMTDGTGSGLTNFVAGMSPTWKAVTGFLPGVTIPFLEIDKNSSFEGSIEIGDKFGMYSIKGSTDGRNITIKSPFGDVKMNAFTGITISAPNGDVKIAGKNVTIEAGNNLTLTSGKNVKDGFWAHYNGDSYQSVGDFLMNLPAAVSKKAAALAGGVVDLTILRHTIEVFMRPIEGKLQVKSNRYLALEAGSGKTEYPVDAFQKSDYKRLAVCNTSATDKAKAQRAQDNLILGQIYAVGTAVTDITGDFIMTYNEAKGLKEGINLKIQASTKAEEGNNILPCKQSDTLIDDIWGNPDVNINDAFMGFQGMLADAADANALTEDMIKFFVQDYTGNEPDEQKTAKKENAFQRHQANRASLVNSVNMLKQSIKVLKDFTVVGRVNVFTDNTAKNALGKNDMLDNSLFKTAFNNTDYKHFVNILDLDFTNKLITQLRRKFFIELIRTYDFKRTATGGIASVGAKVPEAPDPYQDNIEAAWNTYVNSIQVMPQKEIPKDAVEDFVKNNFADPFFKQLGIDFANDFRDCRAFGVGSKGKILFSNGKGTMVLDKDIMRANTDNAEDTDLNGGTQGFVSQIRNEMNR